MTSFRHMHPNEWDLENVSKSSNIKDSVRQPVKRMMTDLNKLLKKRPVLRALTSYVNKGFTILTLLVILCLSALDSNAQYCSDQIINGQYDNGDADWSLYINDSSVAATMTADNSSQLSGTASIRIDVTTISSTEWHIQLAQDGVSVELGKDYQFSFEARSSVNRDLSATIDSGAPNYTGYVYDVASLTTSGQTFTYTFTASATQVNGARIIFNLSGSQPTGSIWIDNVRLEEACSTEICGNSIDDDGDGSVDSDDPDCFSCATGIAANPNFTSDLTSWSDWGNSTIVTEANGNKFVRVTDQGGFGQSVPATPGSVYSLTALGRVSGTVTASIGFSFRDAADNNISGDFTQSVISTSFQGYSVSQVAPANAAFVTPFVWRGSGTTGNADFDAFCLTGGGIEICGNNIDDDSDGLVDTADPDCGPSCLLTNPFPGFPMDFLNNNTGWIDYTLGSNMTMLDNGNGTMTITGSIIDGTPVDFGSGSNGSSCGSTDGWDLTLTLSDKQDWTTFQAAGGSANVHTSCTSEIANLDYWDVTGTLVGTGCNVGRTLTINGPKSPYRFQVGFGGNSEDSSCAFGMSTWFDMTEGANMIPSDIYAFVDQGCYSRPPFDKEVCYLISDGTNEGISVPDTLFTFNYVTGSVVAVGPTGTNLIESMAMDTVNNIVYTIDGDKFGTIDFTTGQFSEISSDVGSTLSGAVGIIDIDDIDGMTYDHANNIVWATERRSTIGDGAPDDLLIQIDPITGLAIEDAFGAGLDYVVVYTNEQDLDDIAIAEDGTLYAISNFGASGNQAFGIINTTTGAWTEIGDYGIKDVESLAFTASGQLVATTGKDGPNRNKIFTIDAGTGVASYVGDILPGTDIEACDCMSGRLLNLQIGDKVFADLDSDGIQDPEEPGVSGVQVNLLNSNGTPFLNDLNAATTTTTDGLGIYNFDGLQAGDYRVEFILPAGTSFSVADQGSDDALDSDANTSNGRSPVVTLSGSTNDISVDAGLLNAGVVVRDCSDAGQLLVANESGSIKLYDQTTGAYVTDFIIGEAGPVEMVAGTDNYLYVSYRHLDQIRRYSLATGVLMQVYESTEIDDPRGLTLGPDGNLYFNSDGADVVYRLDVNTGNFSEFVTTGSGGLAGNRHGIEFGPDGNLYVTSMHSDEVLRYNGTTGAFIDVFVTGNSVIANGPVDLTFGPDGNLYVAAQFNDKIVRYNGSTGAFIDSFVPYQTAGMINPVHLLFGDDGHLYVSSQVGTVGVLKFNGTTGAFIENFVPIGSPNGIYFAPGPVGCGEICINNIDDDGDGLIDSFDPDCSCTPTNIPNIDFNHYPNGAPIAAGTDPSEIWAVWGIHISTDDPSGNPLKIVDSSNPPSVDLDLGTPNEDFAGPGIGEGGESGRIGENSKAMGNLLIISDCSTCDGDKWDGGTTTFTFDTPLDVASIELIDLDYGNVAGVITSYDNNDNIISQREVYSLGDNSYQKIGLNMLSVSKLEIVIPNSHSIASLLFCDDAIPTASIGDFVWNDVNSDGSQANEVGIANVVVSLFDGFNNHLGETTTNSAGYYSFDYLVAGTYSVEIDAPSGYTATFDLNGGSDDDSGVFTLAAGEEKTDVDFGLSNGQSTTPSSCTGFANSVVAETGVGDPTDALGQPDGTYAELYEDTDLLTLDLGEAVDQGDVYSLVWRRKSSYSDNGTSEVILEESSDNINWTTNPASPSVTSTAAFETLDITANVNTRYLRIAIATNSGDDIDLDAVEFDCTVCGGIVSFGNISVSSCIDQPLRDVATVSVEVSWPSSPTPNNDLIVTLGDNVERINVATWGVPSPQTLVFTMPADGSTQTLTAEWGPGNCPVSQTISIPAACTNDVIACDILYLCGLDKPYDGEAWDKGWMQYLDDINGSNTIDAVLTKDEVGMGTYEIMNQNTFVNVDLTAYDLIVISATTEGHISSDLVNALKDVEASVILGNYLLIDDLGMGSADGGTAWGTAAYIDNANSIEILDYDNGPGANGYLMTTGAYGSNASASLWGAAGDANAGTNGIIFEYDAADALPGVANQHGDRFYLGYHFNGIYANTENGGALPSPQSSWFTPEYHLTLEGKERLDQVIVGAGAACQPACPSPPLSLVTVPVPLTCTNTTTTMTASPANLTYFWSDGSTGQSNTVSNPGVYYVTVTDASGCTDVAEGYVVDNTAGPTVELENAAICTQPVELVPSICENYGDFVAQRNLHRNGWNNTLGEPGSALTGDGEFCFTIDSLKDGTIQMIGLNDNPTASRSFTDMEYTFYVWARENLSSYRLYLRENGTQVAYPVNSSTSFVGSELCIKRTGTTVEYLMDGVVLHTSNAASSSDLYIDNSFHSTTGNNAWFEGYSRFTNISLCGELAMAAYAWSTSETTPTIMTSTLGSYVVTVTDAFGCESTASALVSSLNSDLTAAIDFNGNVCFSSGSQLTAIGSGGVPAYAYNWSGPSGFTGSSQTVTIAENGNYFLTITDDLGCEATTSGFVFQEYEPTIVNLQTEVCEGESVELAVSSSSAISYQWSANAGSSSSSSVTVFPTSPASTYTVTVTSDQGCTAVPEIVITANPTPTVDAGSTQTICEGAQVTLQASTPTVGQSPFSYAWSAGLGSGQSKTFAPSGSPLANVTNTYVVTVTDANGCTSTDAVSVNVRSRPTVELSQTPEVCGDGNGAITWTIYDHPNRTGIDLSINGGTNWTQIADNIGTYEFTGLAPGVYDARVRWGDNSCEEDIADVTVGADPKPTVAVTGADVICVGGNTTLSPSFGGTWTSSNPSIASVTSSGLVTGLALGAVTFTFTSNANCASDPTGTVTVGQDQNITITGDNTLCEGDNTTLSSSGTGGSWVSSNTAVATVNASGVVSAVSPGSTTISYVLGANSCGQDGQFPMTVYGTPTVNYSGPTTICEGSSTTVIPSTGGTWTSSNTGVAVITNGGVITGVAPGTATFTFTQGGTDCVSAQTATLTVVDGVEAAIDFNGSNCLENDSQLTAVPTGGTAPYQYTWSGPSGFTGNTATVDITTNGNYFVTITDDLGCTATTSGFVYEQFQAFVINLNTDVCEGESVTITASGSAGVSYQWSANAGSSTDPSITVVPGPPSTTYTVTITNNVGCTAEASATIDVNTVAPISISGNDDICVGGNTTLSPSTGGVWSTANTDIINVSFSGVVTGLAPGTAYVTFTDINNGCESTESLEITVNEEVDPVFSGPTEICIGSTTTVTPNTGGTWSSSNTAVATVTDAGVITSVSAGAATFTYTNTATGCSGTTSQTLVVNGSSNVSLAATAPLCIGEVTSASPSSGGTWTSSNAAIASITNSGVITAVSPGTVNFTYVNTTTGCSSDPTATLTIADRPTVAITGGASICVDGTTSLSPSTGGTWSSENPNIATVNNFGIVTGVQTGSVRFRFTSSTTGCESAYTPAVTVQPSPDAYVVGNRNICQGGTAQLHPSTGGTWVSNNPSVATVTNSGLVSGVQPGSVSFTFTNTTTGCAATTPGSITVFGQPDIQLDGPESICQGTSTTFQPSTGGVWTSSNSSIATISLTGVATGISTGTVTFTYTETSSGCPSDESVTIEVEAAPTVSITGSNGLCPGETTTLTPSSGGAWVSNNPTVATISNAGVVTGISQGLARFTFISDAGCTSNPSNPVIVYGEPVIVSAGGTTTCTGNDINILPSSGGTWESSNTNVATITDAGVISGVSAGVVVFTYTETATGCSSASVPYTITDLPTINISGDANICVGEITNLAPTVGGVWTSNNPTIASIENNGTVVGLQAGKVTFTYTDVSTGCESSPSDTVTVLAAPLVSIVGDTEACVGQTLTLSPSTGGTWTSTNPVVATVTNTGVVTTLAQGSARFRFTASTTSCPSELTDPITVNEPPTVSLIGSPFVCIGSTTTVGPSVGGTWSSSDDNIATISNSGVVTGVATGVVNLTYTDSNTGCSSVGPLEVTVIAPVQVQISGANQICIGSATTLTPTVGGTWVSNNPKIATVTNDGIVRGVAPGSVTFTFLESTTGCTIGNVTDPVSVAACTNPDFNVTKSGLSITSSIATNDNVPVGTVYQNAVSVISKPGASLPTLVINADGTYTFTAIVPGKYVYGVPVCIPPSAYGCRSTLLEITVLDNIFTVDNIVGNPEMAFTMANTNTSLVGQPVVIQTIANDQCVKVAGCAIDPTTVSVVDTPSHGTTSISSTGAITYTPGVGFVGLDTLVYQVCDAMDVTNCQQTRQIITVGHSSASNNLYAADDFDWTMRGTAESGNVLSNDGDPEGDQVTVQAVGSAGSPVSVTGGAYYIGTDGSYTFIPEDSFVGHTEIVYTVCDNNATQACTDATIHILVFDDLSLTLSVYLEGALMSNGGAVGPDGKPLMRDDLRVSPFDGLNHIPTSDPYTYVTGSFDYTTQYTKVGPGLLPENLHIVDSVGVFSVTGHDAIVDWVYVEIRDKDNVLNTLGTRSGLVQRDGDIVDLDGVSPLRFKGINADSFYVVVNHKSHLGAMSMVVPNGEPVDFRAIGTDVFDFGTSYISTLDFTGFATNQNVKLGYRALWAGDFDSNGLIKYDNPNDDQNILFFTVTTLPENVLANSNYDFGYGYYSCDFDMNGKVKYDNPDDDNNMLFFQIIACSLNEIGLSNFNFFIEQVPR